MADMTGRNLAGLILAGGEGRRLGGADKALVPWRGRRLIDHVHARLAPQVATLWVARRLGMVPLPPLDQVTDAPDIAGPLAGVVAGLTRLQATGCDWLMTVPVDVPLVPRFLAEALLAGRCDAPFAIAESADQGYPHYLCALWHRSLLNPVATQARTDPTVRHLLRVLPHRLVRVPEGPEDSFANLNRPEDFGLAGQG